MKNEALALELLNDMNNFINDLVDEFGAEGTISHDTFNKAVELKYRVIADSDLWDGSSVPDNHSECNKHIVIKSVCECDKGFSDMDDPNHICDRCGKPTL